MISISPFNGPCWAAVAFRLGEMAISERARVPFALGFCQGPVAFILPFIPPVISGYRLEIALTLIAMSAFK